MFKLKVEKSFTLTIGEKTFTGFKAESSWEGLQKMSNGQSWFIAPAKPTWSEILNFDVEEDIHIVRCSSDLMAAITHAQAKEVNEKIGKSSSSNG
ncbi:MAG TPA: hypothetical protein VEF04_04895 [Blastocatellia bacterium]|nr:hypothetical protein [Blastocatellia bacterium]